jgi:hypothetical protein
LRIDDQPGDLHRHCDNRPIDDRRSLMLVVIKRTPERSENEDREKLLLNGRVKLPDQLLQHQLFDAVRERFSGESA